MGAGTIGPNLKKGVRGMRRTISAALAALAFTVVLTSPAFAGQPVVRTIEDSGTFPIRCGTMTLVEEYSLSVVVTRWLDGNGDMTRGHARLRFDGSITAPGSTLRVTEVGRFTSFIDGETEREIGLTYKFSAPGLGVVAHSVGLLTSFPDGSVEVKGPHDVSDDDSIKSLLCPLFE